MKKICKTWAIAMATVLLLSAVMSTLTLTAYADAEPPSYLTEGLVAYYNGTQNTEGGHDKSSTVWEDLVGDYDLSVTGSTFVDDGLVTAAGLAHKFPQGVVEVVNGQEFTVEILFGEFISIGSNYNTFLNSTNDNFALYREVGVDQIVFKFAANAGGERPKVSNALSLLQNGLITVTYRVGGSCCIYVNGSLAAEMPCNKVMGANDLFIGQTHEAKTFEANYQSIRFYNRELSAEDVAHNARVDGYTVYEKAEKSYVTIAQPKTNIVGDVAMVCPVNSASELTAMMNGEALPAVAIFTVNADLQILDEEGKAFSTVENILKATEFSVLPVFSVTDSQTIEAVTKHLTTIGFNDVMFVSDDPALIQEARSRMTVSRGVLDLTETYEAATSLTQAQCDEIRGLAKANKAYVVMLPANVCSNDTVQYLYDRQVTVWCRASDNPSAVEQHEALLSGAVGVVSDDTQGLLAVAQSYPENTVTRTSLNIGHRGILSMAPENTVEGYLKATEEGATVVEIDLYMTKDKQLVIFHDETTGRLWNQDLDVKTSTLAELQALSLNDATAAKYPDYTEVKIPSFEECLIALKDVDVQLFLEIKSADLSIVPAMKALVEQYDMTNRCSVISFSGAQLQAVHAQWPEMSVGLLRLESYDNMTNDHADAGMMNVMSAIGSMNATFNPQHLTQMKDNVLRAALLRGVPVYPYSFDDATNTSNGSAYINHFIWGYSGLTGDDPDAMGEFPKALTVSGVNATAKTGDAIDLAAILTKYNQETADVSNDEALSVNIISGGDLVSVEGNQLAFVGAGEVAFTVSYTTLISRKNVNYVTSVMTVQVEAAETQPADTTQGQETTAKTPEDTAPPADTQAPVVGADSAVDSASDTSATQEEGCASLVGGCIWLAVPALGGVTLCRKRKEN